MPSITYFSKSKLSYEWHNSLQLFEDFGLDWIKKIIMQSIDHRAINQVICLSSIKHNLIVKHFKIILSCFEFHPSFNSIQLSIKTPPL